MSSTKRTIVLKGDLHRWHEEGIVDTTRCLPGMLVEKTSAGEFRPHSTRGGRSTRYFAKENELRGGTIDGSNYLNELDYLDDDVIMIHRAQPGDIINALLHIGENVGIGDYAISYGDGTLCKAASAFLANNLAASTATGALSTAENTFSTGTVTIPANTLKAGDVIRIRGQILFDATHSTDTAAVKVKIGTTAILTSATLDVADNDICEFDATLVIRTIGATGTLVGFGWINIGTPGTATVRAGSLASTTIDTTGALTLTVTNTYSVSDAGNHCTLQSLIVEHVGAGSVSAPTYGAGDVIGQFQEALDLTSASAADFCAIEVMA